MEYKIDRKLTQNAIETLVFLKNKIIKKGIGISFSTHIKNSDAYFMYVFLLLEKSRIDISNRVIDEVDRDEYFQFDISIKNIYDKVNYVIEKDDIIPLKLEGTITRIQIIRDHISFKDAGGCWDIIADVAICFFTKKDMLMIEAVDSIAGFLKLNDHIPPGYFSKKAIANTWEMKVESARYLDSWSREIIDL